MFCNSFSRGHLCLHLKAKKKKKNQSTTKVSIIQPLEAMSGSCIHQFLRDFTLEENIGPSNNSLVIYLKLMV